MKLTLTTHDKDLSLTEGYVIFLVESDVSDNIAYLEIGVECDTRDIDFSYGADYGPTYVPYGSTYVMYDKGGSELEGVNANEATGAELERITNDDDKDITISQACELLKCNEATFEACIKEAEATASEMMAGHVQDYYMEHPEEIDD